MESLCKARLVIALSLLTILFEELNINIHKPKKQLTPFESDLKKIFDELTTYYKGLNLTNKNVQYIKRIYDNAVGKLALEEDVNQLVFALSWARDYFRHCGKLPMLYINIIDRIINHFTHLEQRYNKTSKASATLVNRLRIFKEIEKALKEEK